MLDFYREFRDFKAFEIHFNDSQDKDCRLFCNIKSIESNNLLIEVNENQNECPLPNPGDDLKVYIYTENGIYSAISKILSVQKGISSTEYIIEYPKNCKHSQRREYFRADLSVDFKIKCSSKENPKEQHIIESKTKNICGKGMCYISDKPFLTTENISVELVFLEKNVTTKATFVYSKQIIEGNHPKFINAFAFTSISQRDIDLIVKKCFLYQLELRKQAK